MTWNRGEKGWWGKERVEVTRPSFGPESYGDGTVDVQYIDADGKPKPAGTPGAVAFFDHVPEKELSRIDPDAPVTASAPDTPSSTPPAANS